MNQKIAGTVNTLTVWVANCMGTVNTLCVPIQYTLYPPLSIPLLFSSPPSPPSSPTHRYKVKIYRNLKGTKYSSQVHKRMLCCRAARSGSEEDDDDEGLQDFIVDEEGKPIG
jgi:hypothetical protein